MKQFKTFLTTNFVLLALAVGIVYPFLMLGALLPGYSAYPGKAENLRISVINNDNEYGKEIKSHLKENVPFKNTAFETLSQAKEALEDEKVELVIHIPSDFSDNMKKGSANIQYYTSGAVATLTASTVQTAINEIDRSLNEFLSEQKASATLQQLHVPIEQAEDQASNIIQAIKGEVSILHETPSGLHNTMAPLMLSMSAYVVALVGGFLLYLAYQTNRQIIGKWKTWLYVESLAFLISLLAPLVGTGILFLLTSYDASTFLYVWFILSVLLFASFQVNFVSIVLLGISGMSINLGFMFVQIISSGALLPRIMMHAPYEFISHVSPMYYSVNALRNALFAQNLNSSVLISLFIIALISFSVIALIIAFQKIKGDSSKS